MLKNGDGNTKKAYIFICMLILTIFSIFIHDTYLDIKYEYERPVRFNATLSLLDVFLSKNKNYSVYGLNVSSWSNFYYQYDDLTKIKQDKNKRKNGHKVKIKMKMKDEKKEKEKILKHK